MKISALDHCCEKYGCARMALDPKLATFNDCFGGKIRMGDIDGAVERNGHILWLEWKRRAVLDAFDDQHRAQLIMAKKFTLNQPDKQWFVFVIGDPVTMEVETFRIVKRGQWGTEWMDGGTARFREFLRFWFALANGDNWRKADDETENVDPAATP